MSYKIFAPVYLILMILTYFIRGLVLLSMASLQEGFSGVHLMLGPAALGGLQINWFGFIVLSTGILLSIYTLLSLITWMRGIANNYSSRLFLYPLVAGLFDIFIPVPFVPTVLLLCGFFIGIREYIED